MSATPPTVTIAALTYRRPEDLAAALPRLAEQARTLEPGRARVLIVDNDPDASARDVVTGFGGVVDYAHEPTPGIAAARNRALDDAATDLLVFIDDDELPVADWLTNLLAEYDRHPGCLGIVGPVTSEFTADVDPWILAGGFFERRRLASGTPVDLVATNNLLLDLAVLRRLGLRLDNSFGLSGGSDTKFSHDAVAAGGTFFWCAPALVRDMVPAERLTRAWVLQRAYRYGNSWARTRLAATSGARARTAARLALAGQGLARLAAGSGRRLLGRLTGSLRHEARGARTAARGRGILTGVLGRLYVEYRRSGS